MTREGSEIDSTAPGAGRSVGCNDCKASPGASTSSPHTLLCFGPPHCPCPSKGTAGSSSAWAGERNESIAGSMLSVSCCHSPASPLVEEFGQKPKMQRSLGLSVSLVSDRVLWKATDRCTRIANGQACLVNHLGKRSLLSPSETRPTSPG